MPTPVVSPADVMDPDLTPTRPWATEADDLARTLGVSPAVGLPSDAAADRLAVHGRNELAEAPPRRPLSIFLDQFRNPLVLILMGAAVLAGLVGDVKDTVVIAVVLLLNALLGFAQEMKAQRNLTALKSMLVATARVRRDGGVLQVPAAELVPGDVVLVEAGDKVPADVVLVEAVGLEVDESTLTGESTPVGKAPGAVEPDRVLAERTNVLYLNTVVTRGRAEAVVVATGMDTELGRVSDLLDAAEVGPTPLQRQLHTLGQRLGLVALVAVAIYATLSLLRGESITDTLLSSVALAVAAIPEGLPAVVTVTLAIGVSRMARERAIVKRLASVETLGSTTVICSDKTGTLTLNQMTATRMVAAGRTYVIEGLGYGDDGSIAVEESDGRSVARVDADDEALRWALTAAVLCNDAHVRTDDDGRPQLVGDPTEGALVVAARKAGLDPEAIRVAEERLDEVPFDSAVKFMATLHPSGPDGTLLVVKGAPDVVLHRCGSVRVVDGVESVDAERRAELQAANDRLGEQGLRVLAIASRVLGTTPAEVSAGESGDGRDLADEVEGLTLEALIGILDPARPEAVAAVGECRDAGIGVKMITGDHATTAGAIAAELGIRGRVVTGAELEAMSEADLIERIEDIGVCARVSPEHKVRVVKALQARGHVVAMTGDGVNDAPSLKQAEIGVAMGVTGTEVTKEAGDMILTDDNFATIVKAVERGRAIYDNIVTFVRFQLTTNVAAIMTILVARLSGYPAPFNPIQVLFVNILADGPPAMSLGMDPPKPGVMERPPRDRDERILSGARLLPIVATAVIMMLSVMAVLVLFSDSSPNVDPESDPAFTMAFTLFVFSQMVNALIVRSGDLSVFHPFSATNRTLWLAIGAVVVSQVLVVTVPFLQGVFGTTPLDAGEWAVCILGTLPLVVFAEIWSVVARFKAARPAVAASPH